MIDRVGSSVKIQIWASPDMTERRAEVTVVRGTIRREILPCSAPNLRPGGWTVRIGSVPSNQDSARRRNAVTPVGRRTSRACIPRPDGAAVG